MGRSTLTWSFGALASLAIYASAVSCAHSAAAATVSPAEALFAKAGDGLDAQIAAAKAEHLPTTDEELNGPEPATGDNAAPLYTLVFNHLLSHKNELRAIESMRGSVGAQSWNAATAALPSIQNDLNDAIAAANKPRCWVQVDAEALTGHLKQLAKALCNSARLRAHSGDSAYATAALQAAWRMGDHAANEHNDTGYINAVGIKRLVCWTIEAIATDSKGDKTTVRALEQALTQMTTIPDPSLALAGTFSNFWQIYGPTLDDGKGVREELDDIKDDRIFVKGVDDRTLIRGYMTRSLEVFSKEQQILTNRKSNSREKGRALMAYFAEMEKGDDTYRLAKDTLESRDLARILPMVETWLALTSDGLRILEQRQSEGPFSKQATTSVDPYAGEPLKYTATASGFQVSSVGEAGIDPKMDMKRMPPGGRTFSYPCPM